MVPFTEMEDTVGEAGLGTGQEKQLGFGHVKSEFPTGIPGEMMHRQLVICVWKVGQE